MMFGVPSKAGTYTVTFTATRGRERQIASITLNVEALPTWARGSFSGLVRMNTAGTYTYGAASMIVADNGRISGKISVGGTSYTFAAPSIADYIRATKAGESDAVRIEATAKAGREVRNIQLLILELSAPRSSRLVNAAAYADDDEMSLLLYRNIWGDKVTNSSAKSIVANFTGIYTVRIEGDDGGGEASDSDAYGSGYLSLMIDAKTVFNVNVKATGAR